VNKLAKTIRSFLPQKAPDLDLQKKLAKITKKLAAAEKRLKVLEDRPADASPVLAQPVAFDEVHYNSFVAQSLSMFGDIQTELAKTSPDIQLGIPRDSAATANRRIYATAHRTRRIVDNLVLWESHYGAGMVCSPYAMFRHMITQEKYHHLSHVWVVNDAVERAHLIKEWSKYDNVKFIMGTAPEYFDALATAGYVVNNVSLPTFFSKRSGQTIVNTWHSVTVKTLGFDQANGRVESRNVLRAFLATDYLISPNPFMTETYIRAYRLDNVFEGKIIETGFPRADLLQLSDKSDLLARLRERGVEIEEGKKIILLAPTWRGESVGTATPGYPGFFELIAAIRTRLDMTKYQLLIKPHNLMYKGLQKAKADLSQFVPPNIDPNELLSVVDAVISDYSSIFYDFMPTGKPVLFYVPDIDAYQKQRGVVLSFEDLPGPATGDPNVIVDWLNSETFGYDEDTWKRYREKASWAGPHDDGKASERVVEAVFGGVAVKAIPVTPKKKRKKILFYGGSLKMNGVTTSLLALLKALDYDKYDVTVYCAAPTDKIQSKLLSWIPEEVRVLVRVDNTASTLGEVPKLKRFLSGDLPRGAYHDVDIQAIFKREFRRCFGDTKFDFVVDYNGYSLFWPALFAQAEGATSFIWQHNELERDFGNSDKRAVNETSTLPTLASMAGMYEYVDHIVACGESVMKLNREAMGSPSTYSKFTHVQNVVDFSRVQKGMVNRYCFAPPAGDRYDRSVSKALRVDKADGSRRGASYTFADASPENRSGRKATNTRIPLPSTKEINFVTIGRFSSEKNHLALIQAFAMFCQETPKSRLYIIGDGALKGTYEALIDSLDLQKRVLLPGNLKNPFGLASLCDCFILPSIYEGLPISPLEARMMKLPIVMSRFNSVDSVSLPNGQYVIGTSESAILDGLRAFRDGSVTNEAPFDPQVYNTVGLKDFYLLIKGVRQPVSQSIEATPLDTAATGERGL